MYTVMSIIDHVNSISCEMKYFLHVQQLLITVEFSE